MFASESLSPELWDEAAPLLARHYREITQWPDIVLDLDRETYARANYAGALRTCTVRDDGALVGYALFVVTDTPQCRGSRQASEQALYMDPRYRGWIAMRFLAWCDCALRIEGVQLVLRHVKLAHDHGRLLQRLGYVAVETVWERRLDGGSGLDRHDRDLDRFADRREPDPAEGERSDATGTT